MRTTMVNVNQPGQMTDYDRQRRLQDALMMQILGQDKPGLQSGWSVGLNTLAAALMAKGMSKADAAQAAQKQQAQQDMTNSLMNVQGQPTEQSMLEAALAQQQYLGGPQDALTLAGALMGQKFPAPQPPLIMREGEVALDPQTYGVLAENPKPKQSDLTGLQKEAAALYPDDQQKQRQFIESARNKPEASTTVNVGEKQYDTDLSKYHAETFTNAMKAERESVDKVNKLQRLDQLLDKVETVGAGAKTIQGLKKLAKTVGVDLAAIGITDDTAYADAAEALAGEMALQLRNPAGGAGMPGAMSDKDREFLQSMVPGLLMTKEGRKLAIETQRRLAQRDKEVAKMARTYAADHGGRIDNDFINQLADYSTKTPLFSDIEPGTPTGMVTDPQEGATATNPMTGEKIIKRGGQWVTM